MRRYLVACVLLYVTGAWAGAEGFLLTDIQGRTHTLESYRGQWVIVNLWATWCAPCLAEMPELEALSQSRKDLVILGLAGDGQNPGRLAEFIRKLKVTYPIIAGDEKLVQQWGSRVFPTTFVFDPSGNKILTQEGPVTRKNIEEAIGRGE